MSIRIRYGIIGGILCSSSYLYIFNDAIGKKPGEASPYYIFLVYGCLLLSLLFAFLKTRQENEVVEFKMALKTGVAVSFITALIVSISMLVYLKWGNPTWFASQLVKHPEFSEWKAAFLTLNQILFPGAFMSLILSLIFKTRAKG